MNRRERRTRNRRQRPGPTPASAGAGSAEIERLIDAARHRRQAGQARQAEALCRRALAIDPDHGDALHLLGAVALDAGAFAAALQAIDRAIRVGGPTADRLADRGAARQGAGHPEEAEHDFREALAVDPNHADALFGMGLLEQDRGRVESALKLYRAALERDPTLTGALVNLAECLVETGRPEEAAGYYRRLVELAPGLAGAHLALGNVLRDLGRVDEAIAEIERALALDPASGKARAALGVCLQDAGRFDEATRHFEAALELDPSQPDVLYKLAMSAKGGRDDGLIRRIEERLDDPGLAPRERADLCFAAGKRCDDAGVYDTAFDWYRQANALRAGDAAFDGDAIVGEVDRLIEVFSADYFAGREGFGDPTELPVFVVGMPRSGTTLVEQVLASHRAVHGAGELRDVAELAHGLGALIGSAAPYPGCVPDMDAAASRAVAARYVDAMAARADSAARAIDKLPANFMRLGLIAVLLPGARIVHCRRDPLDTCLSCYFQNFHGELTYTNDLAHLGLYYRQYERLMAHWRAVLPLAMMEVRYEDLVANQETTSRALVDFLGLGWDPACLRFFEHDRPILTSSFWQVRQPIYGASVGRWRHYERHLEPLKQALAP